MESGRQSAIKVRISNKGAEKRSFLGILFAGSVNTIKLCHSQFLNI